MSGKYGGYLRIGRIHWGSCLVDMEDEASWWYILPKIHEPAAKCEHVNYYGAIIVCCFMAD